MNSAELKTLAGSPPGQAGVGMVEILVTLAIITVGFLSMAALQSAAMRSSASALQHMTALLLTQDMVERLQANPDALATYLTTGIGGASLPEPAADCVPGNPCTPAQLAALDLYQWEQLLDGAGEIHLQAGELIQTGGLPGAVGCITGPAHGGNGAYTITVVWRGLSSLANDSADSCGRYQSAFGADLNYRRLASVTIYLSVET